MPGRPAERPTGPHRTDRSRGRPSSRTAPPRSDSCLAPCGNLVVAARWGGLGLLDPCNNAGHFRHDGLHGPEREADLGRDFAECWARHLSTQCPDACLIGLSGQLAPPPRRALAQFFGGLSLEAHLRLEAVALALRLLTGNPSD